MNHIAPLLLQPQRQRRGIALVITLLLLVLLSAFAVAFFTRMSVEQVSAASYADGVTTRQLAESAVGLVQSQIREATSVPNAAWGSQPGMIRTFGKKDNSGAASNAGTVASKDPYAFYKLYSSNDMTVTERAKLESFDPAEELDSDWAKERALWTDLNEPVRVRTKDPSDDTKEVEALRYPIIDPQLAADSDTKDMSKLSVHNTTRETKIEGFSIDSAEDKGIKKGQMPVRWMYVLRDGTLTAPSSSEGDGLIAKWDEATVGKGKVPTKVNPIVGRVAFWTDDDTSKVNINTAGGYTTKSLDARWDSGDKSYAKFPGSYWDTPRFVTTFDRGGNLDVNKFGEFQPGDGGLAISQPPANEFQRYPGHPATTSLGLVFSRTLRGDGSVDDQTPRLTSEQLYRLLPRLQPGGTKGGSDRQIVFNNTNTANNMSDKKLPLKAERLYASVDEFFFAARQTGTKRQTTNAFLKTSDNTDPRNQIPGMTEDLIGKTDLDEYQGYRFFLTAHSRAPELNLFGRPRVSIWPVWASFGTYAARRNPIDRLMMFCSTLGPIPKTTGSGAAPVGKLFMFQRWQPYDPYADVNITRNADLLQKYLAGSRQQPGLTDQPIPGFTDKESFASKYNGGDNVGSRDQILTEIFDYIRSGVNLRDTYYDRDYMGRTLTAAEITARDMQRYAPRGVVIPAAVKFPQSSVTSSNGKEIAGFGRFPTVSEVSLVFYHAGYIDRQGQPYWDPRLKTARGVTENLMRMFIVIETYNPMQGYARTEDTSKDDRNLRPDRLTHFIEVVQPPTVMIEQPGGGVVKTETIQFPPGLLENEIFFRSGSFAGGSDAAGMEGTLHTFGRRFIEPGGSGGMIPPDPQPAYDPSAYTTAVTNGGLGVKDYKFQSVNVIRVPQINRVDQTTFKFGGFKATLRIRFGGQELQFINLDFPPSASDWPLPSDAFWEDPGSFAWRMNAGEVTNGEATMNTQWTGRGSDPWAGAGLLNWPATMKSLAHRVWWLNEAWPLNGRAFSGTWSKYDNKGKELFDSQARGFRFDNRWRNLIQSGDTVRSLVPAPANNTDLRTIAIMRSRNGDTPAFEPLLPGYHDPTVRHVQVNPVPSGFAIQTQILRNGGGTPFVHSNQVAVNTWGPTSACSIEPAPRRPNLPANAPYLWERKSYGPISTTSGGKLAFGNLAELPSPLAVGDYGTRAADLPASQAGRKVNGVTRFGDKPGDFDTGIGSYPDGSLCNKPDEGHLIWRVDNTSDDHAPDPAVSTDWFYRYPYYISEYNDEATDTFFSPSRQVPSPVIFGSLLVGAKTGWQTLCLSPNPVSLKGSTATGKADHPGFDIEPKDHLLLDLFTMPVVEPYAISEPFSTAGKVNLNCELVPFSYIRRTTALRAVLHSMRVTAVQPNQVKTYKSNALNENYRLLLNRDETIKGITAIFEDTSRPATERFYKSATQICERFLYPAKSNYATNAPGPTWSRNESEIRKFWEANNLGGDNTREKPYADIYPRLTTKSNTYTVHMRIQKLRPQKGRTDEDFKKWTEGEDVIAAEYRGEVQIERYLDPQDRRFDPADATIPADEKFDVDATVYRPNLGNTRPLEFAYRFRTVSSKRFSPAR